MRTLFNMRTLSKTAVPPIATLAAIAFLFSVASPAAEAAPAITDQSISDKIDDELLWDPGVISTRVDVHTSDGIVTLTGSVSHLLAKERAARVAETVKGVRAVINRIEVSPSVTRADAQVRRDVEAALREDPATDSYKIATSVAQGEVTLTGTVDSHRSRELAKTVAKGVRGVRSLDDRLDVDYRTDRTDSEIEEEIRQSLHWNRHVDHYLVDVAVSNGTAALSGTVGSAAEKRIAESDAWVAGVTSVDTSQLSVQGWARDEKLRGDKYVVKSQDELREAVDDALMKDPRVLSFDVDVDVTGNTVTLRGEVDNLQAKRVAGQNAKNTVGVSRVDNRLKVRPGSWRDDSLVAEDIRRAMLRDPYIERFEVTVAVTDGTAHLYGAVDSYFERRRAHDVASRVRGVLDVENHLTVDYDTAFIGSPYVDDTISDDELIRYERRSPGKTDRQIKDSIESQLWWSPFVTSDQVNVAVDNGVATLTGVVDTPGERRAATDNAYQGGATLVENNLVVDHEG